ncbi:SARP family transcriptional regulator [Nonomuraea phyllanthi]|uniref:AfsR/SARP family transcriptional regulator n=1 Tax=Nonomuraea phyllanthi TaxID=2219224 RepID=UPI001293042B|nr:AfsR/SARP family transcriptional regulator [Nonomuraea phyllanthi]QFY07513.1 SARP family transcriptional regulator [Nonomuraea phyllanthi]
MDFYVLGPLTAESRGESLDLGSARQRIVLAALLLDANRTVTVNRLMEAVYGQHPPVTSRAQVQVCVSGLRRLFGGYGQAGLIVTTAQGYAIQIPGERLDVHRFQTALARARQARDECRQARAIELYREALALWRGPALDGIRSGLVQAAAGRLAEERITTAEECVRLELDLGGHDRLVGELTRLVRDYPLREELRGQLMRALYRSGRPAEALEVYRQTRQTWAEELGIEPNERLRLLQQAILADEEHPDLAERVRGRASLTGMPPPPPVADFTGRAEQLARIRTHLTGGDGPARARLAVPVTVIVGKAGVGKTSVAARAAHDLARHFRGGRLFAALQAGSGRPVSPSQVLERFLTALGVPASEVPEGLEERAETYRHLLAARRTLIVLDDVAGEGQVLPLLPGHPGAAVVITSRRRLSGLAGADHVEVPVFEPGQSVELLSRIAGAERVGAEPEAAVELAALCGHLPLALRVAGARLAARPLWSLRRLVERLRDETRRLDELRYGDMGVRGSITLSYDALDEDARRLFRRLAIPDVGEFPAWIGAALVGRPPAEGEDLLADLADVQLVEAVGVGRGAEARYRFHDLIRVFAKERLAAEESATERGDALARMLGALLLVAETARDRHDDLVAEIAPGPYDDLVGEVPGGGRPSAGGGGCRWMPPELAGELAVVPLCWMERERRLLLAGVRQAAQAGLPRLCGALALSMLPLFESGGHFDDWRESHEVALAAAERAGDRTGVAALLGSLSTMCRLDHRPEEARRPAAAAGGTDARTAGWRYSPEPGSEVFRASEN